MQQKKIALAVAMAISLGAQGAESSDLAAIRAQIEDMKKNYEQRIAALEQKLAQAEAKVERVEQRPVQPTQAAGTASSFNPEISLILQGQYRNMKNIPGRGITGFWPGGEEDTGGIRGFSIDHTELVLSANVDPYWRGQAVLALIDGEVEVEEANFRSLGLGNGMGLKAGRYRSGIGYLNEQHRHQWDFADAPLMYRAMFGGHAAYAQDGVQLKWLAPTPVFLEFGAEAGRGAAFPGTDRNRNGSGAGALFVHVGDDVGVANSWRAGLSYLRTSARDRETTFADVNSLDALGTFTGKSSTWLADFVWKWAPNGNPKYQNFKFQAEYFVRREKGNLTCDDADPTVATACSGGFADNYRTRQSGWYAQGVYQFTPAWRAGLRYEQLNSGTRDFGINAANLVVDSYRPRRATAMVDYNWSEFSRLRLQYAQDKSMQGVTDNQVTLQYIMSLGAHGAHKF
jgi:hypothetical protein